MPALFFGDSASPLFGFHTEPAGDRDKSHGVLVCPPIAQEHVRTHWALRQLAQALSRAGFHVFRFDWFGTGDSAGSLEEATLDRWVLDAEAAAAELRDTSGLRKISVVGLRLGASIAALAARRVKPRALLLWDPVADGARYLADLDALQRAMLEDPKRYAFRFSPEMRKVVPRLDAGLKEARPLATGERVGMVFSPALEQGLRALDAGALVDLGKAVPLLCEHADAGDDGSAFERAWLAREGAAPIRKARAETPAGWTDPSKIEVLLLPADALRIITTMLDEAT